MDVRVDEGTLWAARWGCSPAADASLRLYSADVEHWPVDSVVSPPRSVITEKQMKLFNGMTETIWTQSDRRESTQQRCCRSHRQKHDRYHSFTILTNTTYQPVSINMHTTLLASTARVCALQRTHTDPTHLGDPKWLLIFIYIKRHLC